jgi:hypothetical protein
MILTRIKLWLAAAGAAVLAILGVYLQGRRDAASRARTDELKGYKNTREAIDDAEIHGNDPAAAREWLQHYADQERRRDL